MKTTLKKYLQSILQKLSERSTDHRRPRSREYATQPLEARCLLASAPTVLSPELWALALDQASWNSQFNTWFEDHQQTNPALFPTAADAYWLKDSQDRIGVRLLATDPQKVLPALQNLGMVAISVRPAHGILQGFLPGSAVGLLDDLADEGLTSAEPIRRPLTHSGTVLAQSDLVHQSSRLRSQLAASGLDGSGVKLAIISDSFNALGGRATDVAAGELPANVTVLGDAKGTDEGRAMAQVIHDIAPGASLLFASGITLPESVATTIRSLAKTHAADIIVDDLVFPDEPVYQPGAIAQAVTEVWEQYDVSYFTAVGNTLNGAHEWQQPQFGEARVVRPGKTVPTTLLAMEFAPGKTFTEITVLPGETLNLSLYWDSPWDSTVLNDLDLVLIDAATSKVVAERSSDNPVTKRAVEHLTWTNPGPVSRFRLIVRKFNKSETAEPVGRVRLMDWSVNQRANPSLAYPSPASDAVSHAGALGAIGVGAVHYWDSATPTSYSADGDVVFLFDAAGNRLQSPEQRTAPLLVAADGVNTSFFGSSDIEQDGSPNFFGTSASAASAAAIAALVRQKHPQFTADQVRDLLISSAVDLGTPGVDAQTGHGRIDAFAALFGAPVPAIPEKSVTFESGIWGADWQSISTGGGMAQVLQGAGIGTAGSLAALALGSFGVDDTPGLSIAQWHVNLAQHASAVLTFDVRRTGNSGTDEPMPATFTDLHPGDGLALSVDHVNWFRLASLTSEQVAADWQRFRFDLKAFAAEKSLELNSHTLLRFQHHGKYEQRRDGLMLDNIQIETTGFPVLAEIASQTIAEDNTAAVSYALSDPDTPRQNLNVTVTSSNTTLIPASGISIGEQSIALVPALNQFGSSRIRVTATDPEGHFTVRDFVLTVTPVNDLPSISSISSQEFPEDTSGFQVAFTIDDVETVATQLQVTATSSNGNVIPADRLTITGTDKNRKVVLAGADNAFGSSEITVRVEDAAGGSTERRFVVTVGSRNDAPQISAIAAQTTDEDTATTAIGFNVTDIETPAADLTVTLASSNTALVKLSGMTLSGTSGARSLQITPEANAFGQSEITVTVRDADGATSTSRFLLTVRSVNDLPSLSAFSDQTVLRNSTLGPLAFTIADLETAVAELSLSAASSNPDVVKAAGITFAGSGASRTLTIVPVEENLGATTITIQVADRDGGTFSRSFQLLVRSATNTPPTISSIATQTTAEDVATGKIAFTVADIETPTQALVVEAVSSNPALIATGGILLEGTNGQRTVTLTPLPNQSGTALITLSVYDTQGSKATSQFQITVNAVNDAPTLTTIADQRILEDTSTSPLSVWIDDPETPVDALVLSVSSSHPDVIDSSGIVLSGTGRQRTLLVTPRLDQSGDSDITLLVRDAAGLQATTTFRVTVDARNDHPTLAPLADLTIDEDSGEHSMTLSLADVDSAAADLQLYATSSHSSVLSGSDMRITGTGYQRTLHLAPPANARGISTVSVNVVDGSGGFAVQRFRLQVNSINDSPTVSSINNQTIAEDTQSGSIAFQIADVETPADQLIVSVVSSNTQLIPAGSVTLSGTGPSRTLILKPAANLSGAANLTVEVRDPQGGSASSQFTLTVTPVNDAPAMVVEGPASSGSRVDLSEDHPTLSIPIVVSDVESTADSLQLTVSSSNSQLYPASGLVLSGSGSQRLLQLTPALNAVGTADIRLTLTDPSGASSQRTISLSVSSINDPPVLSAFADVTIAPNTTSSPIDFSVSDVETSPGSLTLTVVSGSQSLIPNANLTVTGSGANRSLRITPATDAVGVAAITVELADADNLKVSRTFFVTVSQAANTPPQITAIPDTKFPEDTTSDLLSFRISDQQTDSSLLRVTWQSSNPTLIHPDDILLTGSGTDRNLQLIPRPDQFGTARITVAVQDQQGEVTTTSFLAQVAAVNDAPKLTVIPDQTIEEDKSTGNIAFQVTDVDSPAETLPTRVFSDNPWLILANEILFTGDGSSRTLQITPVANRFGTALITLQVSDGLSATERSFRVTVTPVNDAPTLTTPRAPFVNSNAASAPALFRVFDYETPANQLVLTATSSDQAVVPDSGLTLAGTLNDRTLTIVPNRGTSGPVTITLTVSDGELTATTSLVVDVTARDQTAPVISSVEDQRLQEDLVDQQVSFTVADAEKSADQLVVGASSKNQTLIANSMLTLSGTGSNRSLRFTSAANRFGTVEIVLAVSDGTFETTTSFLVTILPVNDPPEQLGHLGDLTLAYNFAPRQINLAGLFSDQEGQVITYAASAWDVDTPTLDTPSSLISASVVNQTLWIRSISPSGGQARVVLRATDSAGGFVESEFIVTVGEAVLLFNDGFETGVLQDHWRVVSSGYITTQIATVSSEGGRSLAVDGTSANDLQVGVQNVIIELNIRNWSNVVLEYSSLEVLRGGQPAIPDLLPEHYTSLNAGGDGVSISVDGFNWYRLLNNQRVAGRWVRDSAGISRHLAELGLANAERVFVNFVTKSRTFLNSTYYDDIRFVGIGGVRPTIQSPTEVSATEDADWQQIPITGLSSGTGESQQFRVTATLEPNSGIADVQVLHQPNATDASVRFLPAANRFGSAVIKLMVEDAGADGDFATLSDNGYTSQQVIVNLLPVNDPPAFAPVDPVTVAEDTPLLTVPVTGIQAGPFEDQGLRVTVQSSNPDVVPVPIVGFAAGSETASLLFRPPADAHGQSVITVTLQDAGLDGNLDTPADNGTAVREFVFKVTPVNDRPLINSIPAKTIDEDSPEVVLDLAGIFAGGGEDQPLRVTAVSSNTELIPNPTITYTSPQNTGKLAFTPIPDQSGLAEITITIEDGGLDGKLETTADNATFTRTFTVTVRPLNDLPTLNALEGPAIDEDAAEHQIDIAGIFAGGGEDQPLRVTAVSSNTQLIPNPTITYTSPQNTGKLALTPIPDQSGLAEITITVEDGGFDGKLETTADNATSTRTFTVTVRPVNDAPTLDQPLDLTIDEDSTAAIQLSGITPGGGESQSLRVRAFSGDPALLPHPEVIYSGGSAAELRLRPVSGRFGVVPVTISVEDAGLDGRLETTSDNGMVQRVITLTVRQTRPRITAPGSGTPSQRPTVTWTAVPEAVSYEVWLRNITMSANSPVRAAAQGTSWTPEADVGIGQIEVYVRGMRATGKAMPWSSRHTFSVTSRVTLQPVEKRQSTSRPTLAWSAVPGAISYDIWIDNVSTGQKQYVRQTTGKLQWTPDFDMPLASYQVWVRALAAGGFAAGWSLRTDFFVAAAPRVLGPTLPTFNDSPVFTWDSVAGADKYGVFVRSMSTGVTVANVTGLTSPSWFPPRLAEGAYEWWAFAESSATGIRGFWSRRTEFYVGGRTRITEPSKAVSGQSTEIKWLAVEWAERYELWVNGEREGAGFINVRDLQQASYVVNVPLRSNTTYRAWVRAVSFWGQVSVWSPTFEIIVAETDSPMNPLTAQQWNIEALIPGPRQLLAGIAETSSEPEEKSTAVSTRATTDDHPVTLATAALPSTVSTTGLNPDAAAIPPEAPMSPQPGELLFDDEHIHEILNQLLIG